MKAGEQSGGPSAPGAQPMETGDVIESPKAWGIAACLFLELVIVFGGGFNTFVIFYAPFFKEFHWTRADVGLLTTVLCFGLAAFDLIAGWLLERISARIVMTIGAAAIVVAFVWASRIHSYGPMVCAWALMGFGLAFSTLVPTNVVASKWFDRNRGLALGFVTAGTAGGGLLMINVGAYWLVQYGWRTTYLLLALPILLLAIPLIIFTAREPKLAVNPHEERHGGELEEGLTVREGLASRAFWMPTLVLFMGLFAISIPLAHVIPYLIGLGFRPERAAMALSFCHGFGVPGCFIMGWLADRVGAKPAIVLNYLMIATGLAALFGAHHVDWVAVFVVAYGLNIASGSSLLSLLLSQSVGLKNFASFWGFTQTAAMLALGIGPFVAGKIFDLTNTYSSAFKLGIIIEVVGIVLVLFTPRPRFRGGRAH